MAATPLTFPPLVLRLVKGAELTFQEGDNNWANTKAFCIALANLIATSLNPDGTLAAGSVGTQQLQMAAVTLSNLNPSLLYSIIPVDTDTGTIDAYAITTVGGLGGTNLITGGSVYDANGNFTLTGLSQNLAYFWTKGLHDASCVVNSQQTLSSSGAFTATATSITLTGTPNSTVTATVVQSAAITAYKNNQFFFVYTANANAGASTLNVNNLGAIPILQNGQPLQANAIGASSVFAVMFLNGSFILFNGGSGSGGNSNSTTLSYTLNGTTIFTTGQIALPGTGISIATAHGLGQIPSAVSVLMVKIASDGTDATIAVGESVPVSEFVLSAGGPAFTYSFDATFVNVTQNGTPNIGGADVTPANWQLVINATKQASVSTTVLPALTYQFPQPEGAFSYKNNLLIMNFAGAQSFTVAIDLTTNLATALNAPNAGVPRGCNGSIFTRANGVIQVILSSNSGIYSLPVTSPAASIVPQFVVYTSAGTYILAVVSGTSYVWTQGGNDVSYSLDGGTTFITTPAFTGPVGGSIILKGNPNASVTAQVTTTGAVWQPVRLLTTTGASNFKPCWFVESGGTVSDVYSLSSNLNTGTLNAVTMKHSSSSGTVNVGTPFDFTNSGIANWSNFGPFAGGTSAKIMLCQYNPLTKRIYLIEQSTGLLHIFVISGSYGTGGNDITLFWVDAARYANTSYVKTIGIAGDGANWGTLSRCNITVEWDQSTGVESAIVFSREGNVATSGSVTRIPWIG